MPTNHLPGQDQTTIHPYLAPDLSHSGPSLPSLLSVSCPSLFPPFAPLGGHSRRYQPCAPRPYPKSLEVFGCLLPSFTYLVFTSSRSLGLHYLALFLGIPRCFEVMGKGGGGEDSSFVSVTNYRHPSMYMLGVCSQSSSALTVDSVFP